MNTQRIQQLLSELMAELSAPDPVIEEWITTKEACEILKVSVATMSRLAVRGEIPARKIGGQWRFLRSEIEGFE